MASALRRVPVLPRPAWLALFAAACSYRPARFSADPPVLVAGDDKPCKVPRKHAFISELHDADVYVRRELVKDMDPSRSPDAGDVNALDEVVRSSWFRGGSRSLARFATDGPPLPPLSPEDVRPASETPGASVVKDARGLFYELVPDIRGRRGMRTAAAAIASRLVYALGYGTPEVHLVVDGRGERWAATRWPLGIDLGPTPIDAPRDDDANDRVDHRDRRSLRALKLVAAWLDVKQLPPRMLRDAYLGAPGKGHVAHFIVGLDGALGVDRYRDQIQWLLDSDRQDSNFFLRLFSLGLSPKPSAFFPETPWPSVGVYQHYVVVGDYTPAPPFEPIDRLLPGDAYWAGKAIAALPDAVIAEAVAAGQLGAEQARWLQKRLSQRRGQVVAWGFDRTTPLELVALTAASPGHAAQLVLADLAIATRMMSAARSSYRVRFLDAGGNEVGAETRARPAGERVIVPLAAELRQRDYLVVQILGSRDGAELPAAMEVHLRKVLGGFAVAGVRH